MQRRAQHHVRHPKWTSCLLLTTAIHISLSSIVRANAFQEPDLQAIPVSLPATSATQSRTALPGASILSTSPSNVLQEPTAEALLSQNKPGQAVPGQLPQTHMPVGMTGAAAPDQPSLGSLPSAGPVPQPSQTSETLTGPLPAYRNVAAVALERTGLPGSTWSAGQAIFSGTGGTDSSASGDGPVGNVASPALAPETLGTVEASGTGDPVGTASPANRPGASRVRNSRRAPRKRAVSHPATGPAGGLASTAESTAPLNGQTVVVQRGLPTGMATAAFNQIPSLLFGSVPALSLTWDDGPQARGISNITLYLAPDNSTIYGYLVFYKNVARPVERGYTPNTINYQGIVSQPIVFGANETITGTFGTTDSYYLRSLGFTTSSRRIPATGAYGSWSTGSVFVNPVNTYSIFGALTGISSNPSAMGFSGIGFWIDAPSPPPAPPAAPRPPPPVVPASPPAPNLGRIRAAAIGDMNGDGKWDDGSLFSGITGINIWLTFDKTLISAIQVAYVEQLAPIRGTTYGRDGQPDFAVTFGPNSTLVGAFGYTDAPYSVGPICCYLNILRSIGFRTASGQQFGVYGPTQYGNPYTFAGTVRGFYGATSQGLLRTIGFWTDAPAPPPLPPSPLPPPPSNGASSPPPPPPAPKLGRIQIIPFGDINGDGRFDDGPLFRSILSINLWLYWDQTYVTGIQVVYAERPGSIRGTSLGRDTTPDITLTLQPGEIFSGMFGYTDTQYQNGMPCCNNVPIIRAIGFRTSSGRQFGLYGPNGRGTPFSFQGSVRAIFGATTYGFLRSIGAWTDAPPPPPAPPLSPPPPFPPPAGNASSPPPPPNLGRARGPVFGDVNGDGHWDDTPLPRSIVGINLWFYYDETYLTAFQAIYSERPGPIRGNTLARDTNPDFTITLLPREQLTGIFGYTDTQYQNGLPCCNNNPIIRGIGFWTSLGNQYGQYGPAWGSPFSYNQIIRSFYGATYGGFMRSIGVYVDVASPPPAPPSRPPPPPALAVPPSPNLGRIKFPSYGDPNGDAQWDDGPTYTGILGYNVWLYYDTSYITALQFVYREGLGPVRGNTYGRSPDYSPSFVTGDIITGAFLYTDSQYQNGIPCCSNVPILRSFGVWTASGRQYGPHGQQWGTLSTFIAPVRGFYGSLTYGFPRSIGFWSDAPAPPPRTPLLSSPTLSPAAPPKRHFAPPGAAPAQLRTHQVGSHLG
eukprot:jgi/Botrbrau1/21858/Bobra.0190s0069.1